MSSYFASFTSSAAISNLSTRFTSLRRAISSDETDDPDSEDSSHISNVLRAYYAEKGRVLPPWLPPDPKAPAASTPAIATVQRQQVYGEAASVPAIGAGRGGLSDLWGDDSSQQPPAQQTMSLRRPRGAPQQVAQQQGQPLLHVSSAPSSRPSTSTGSSRNPAGYVDRPEASLTPPPSSGARPLPSQRAGSYQASQAAAQQQSRLPLDRASSSGSAQDRLRARLHGGSSSSGGGGSSGSAPPTLSPGYSGGGGGGGQPYAAAGRPWESGDSGFGGGYGSSAYGGNSGRSPAPTGLPSGPRPPRR